MAKIEQKFIYGGDTYKFLFASKGINVYVTEEDDSICLITDRNNEVLAEVHADCMQGIGFLNVLKPEQS